MNAKIEAVQMMVMDLNKHSWADLSCEILVQVCQAVAESKVRTVAAVKCDKARAGRLWRQDCTMSEMSRRLGVAAISTTSLPGKGIGKKRGIGLLRSAHDVHVIA